MGLLSDSEMHRKILGTAQRLHDQGITVIVVTHDPRMTNFATRSVHMLDGKIMVEKAAPLYRRK